MKTTTLYLSVFFSTLVSTVVLTRLCRSIALKLETYDRTNSRKVHKNPKPLLGGVAVFLGFFVPLLFFSQAMVVRYLFVGALLITSLGLVDDLYDLSGIAKILGLAIAVVLLAPAGQLTSFFVYLPFSFYLNLGITIFWVVLLVSAINAIDNMDGLAPGLAMIASLMFFVVGGVQFHQPLWATISLGFTGALLGFLLFNFYPSTIFLGDSGSFLVGYVLAVLGIMGTWSTNPLKSILIPVVILIVPIFDLIFVVLYRFLIGETDSVHEAIEYSAKDHLSHRIQQVMNFGQRRTVLIVYLLGLISGLIGIIMRNTHPFEAIIAFALALLFYVLIILLILPNFSNINWRW